MSMRPSEVISPAKAAHSCKGWYVDDMETITQGETTMEITATCSFCAAENVKVDSAVFGKPVCRPCHIFEGVRFKKDRPRRVREVPPMFD